MMKKHNLLRLTAPGYAGMALENAGQALARITLLQPHLIITGLRMGGMDGMTLFDQVHTRNPSRRC